MTTMTDVEEGIAEALEAMGLGCKRRDEAWVIPATGQLCREIQITSEGGTLRAQAVLVEWDEIGPDERRAVTHFLDRAQTGLRFVRCELEPTRAVVTGRVEGTLTDTVGGVMAGCRLLAREVGALLFPEAARVYLDFLARQDNESEQGERRRVLGTLLQES
jgi:hypothetical protein